MLRGLFVSILCAAVFAAPAVNRVLRFTHIDEPQSVLEAATVVRSVGEIRDVKADPQARTLTLSGEAWQLELADWILGKLDRIQSPARSGPERYDIAGVPDPAVRIFYPARAETVANLQELSVLVRSVVEIRRVFTFNATRAAIVRGTPDQVEAAEWLFRELDAGPGNRAPAETRLPGDSEGIIRVFYLQPSLSLAQFQQNAVEARRATGIRRIFTFNDSRAIALRGTAEQVTAAERLFRDRQLLVAEP
jgi:hypothetical protein